MLKRKAYTLLLEWKNTHKNTCLMVKGARQVGKTFLVRAFGKENYKSYIEINFLKNPELKNIFSDDLSATEIYKRITANINGAKLIPGDTLIFLDEIQVCGNARTSIKFLAEDGTIDVISSGSLLGLNYGDDDDSLVEEPSSVPTGYEDFVTMYSLDFEEFLWANGITDEAISILREYYDKREAVPEDINNKYLQLFREYMVVGGMPDVVVEYINTKDFGEVARVQERIIENYKMDIAKHAKGAEKIKVKNCYDAIPKQLSKEIKKFQYSTVEKGRTSKKYGGSIRWLLDSALVNASYNVSETYIPLMANAKEQQFKLYFNDTGLLCATYGFETKRALLMNTLSGNAKGGIYENIISECLIKNGYKLYYYKPNDNHELEFLIEKDGQVIPIEVKAGNNASKSLNTFIKKYKPDYAYKLTSGNVGLTDTKLTLPHYMVMFL